jgi:cephalosporin hydroxylase
LLKRIVKKLKHIPTRPAVYPSALVNPLSTEFEVNNWVLSDFIVCELIPIVGVRPFPLNELLLMCGALVRFQPEHLFEWGTNIGKSARIFLETRQRFYLETSIHSIDLPEDATHVEHPGKNHAILLKGVKGVNLYRGDGLEVSQNLADRFGKSMRYLFFLDGDHSFESVSRELQTVTSAFPTASILVHDTFYQDPACGYNIGPYNAIRHTIQNNPGRYKLVETRTGLPGMSLLTPV